MRVRHGWESIRSCCRWSSARIIGKNAVSLRLGKETIKQLIRRKIFLLWNGYDTSSLWTVSDAAPLWTVYDTVTLWKNKSISVAVGKENGSTLTEKDASAMDAKQYTSATVSRDGAAVCEDRARSNALALGIGENAITVLQPGDLINLQKCDYRHTAREFSQS